MEILEIIDVSHVNLLLQNYPIGLQIRFIHNLIAWRKSLGVPFNEKSFDQMLSNPKSPASVSSADVSDNPESLKETNVRIHNASNVTRSSKDSTVNLRINRKPQLHSPKINLRQILLNSPPNGPDLIELYGKQQHFTPLDRKRLMTTIVNYFLECKIPLNLQISYELENAIVQMFPSESLRKYRNSRYGKLYFLYLREKTEQVDSESYSDIEEYQENNLPHDSEEDNISDSLMCDLYDKENADVESDDDGPVAAEELEHE